MFDFLDEMTGFEYLVNEGEYTEEDDAQMESYEEIECYDSPEEATYRLAMECSENFYKITNAITADEFRHYISTNEEMVYEEGKIRQIVGTISKWIERAWQKLKGLFTKLFLTIDSWIRGDDSFMKKYESTIRNSKASFKYKGYEFDVRKITTPVCGRAIDAFTKVMGTHVIDFDNKNYKTADDFDKEAAKDKIRGEILGKKDLTGSEFSKGLKEYFFGEKDEYQYTPAMASTIITEIKGAKKSKEAAKKAYADTKKTFNKVIKKAKDMETRIIKDEGKEKFKERGSMKTFSIWCSLCKSAITISHVALNSQLSAIRASHFQARALASRVVSGRVGKQDSVGEGFSALSNLELI